MITMDKKYRCRDGVPVTVLAVGVKPDAAVVILRHNYNGIDSVLQLRANGKWSNTEDFPCDLIEIVPYDDFKIDDPVMVKSDGAVWLRRYFAGVDTEGSPTTFNYGATSWSTVGRDNPQRWKYCRRPTPKELGE